MTASAPERTYTVHLRRPHARQREFLESPAKRKVIRAGRRGGKTTGVGIMAVEAFLAGRRVLYAAPTQEQVDAFWWEVKRALAEPIDAGVFVKNESLHIIELPGTKQRIRAKTAWNADTLRGDYADLLILDEWQLMDEQAWELVGAPMLLDNDGDAVFVYTPPSLASRSVSKARDPRHAAKMFKRAQTDRTGRWEAFHFTSRDNPHISAEALADLAADMTELAIRQEIEAEDVDEPPGAVYDGRLVQQAIERGTSRRYEGGLPAYAGLDWGFAHPTALEICQVSADDEVRWIDEKTWRAVELNRRCAEIVEMCRRYSVRVIYADAAGATENDTLASHLKHAGLQTKVKPVSFAKYKHVGIHTRRWYLERGREAIGPRCARLAEDTKQYRYREGKDEVVKEDDHTVDAATAFYASRSRRLVQAR